MQSRFTHRFLASAGAAACAAALLLAQPASAQTEAITSFTSDNSFRLSGFSVGYTFSLTSTITVTSLGYFDYQLNGLAESHQVAIYNAAGTQLFTAVVQPGTVSAAGSTFIVDGNNSAFRYQTIASQVLAAGNYTIAGFSGTLPATAEDEFFYNASGLSTSAPFVYGAGVAQSTPAGLSTTAPTGNPAGVSYFGPSFRFGAGASAPEPGTIALLATGLVGMGGVRIRSRRKKAAK